MQVILGNANALEAYVDGDTMMYRQVPGERETTFFLPDGVQTLAAMNVVVTGMTRMINLDARPWWIECPDANLTAMLLDHYGLPATACLRPAAWGDGTTTAPKAEPKKKKGDN